MTQAGLDAADKPHFGAMIQAFPVKTGQEILYVLAQTHRLPVQRGVVGRVVARLQIGHFLEQAVCLSIKLSILRDYLSTLF